MLVGLHMSIFDLLIPLGRIPHLHEGQVREIPGEFL